MHSLDTEFLRGRRHKWWDNRDTSWHLHYQCYRNFHIELHYHSYDEFDVSCSVILIASSKHHSCQNPGPTKDFQNFTELASLRSKNSEVAFTLIYSLTAFDQPCDSQFTSKFIRAKNPHETGFAVVFKERRATAPKITTAARMATHRRAGC